MRMALGVIAEIVRAKHRRLLVLWLATAVAYQLFLIAPFVAFGRLPNYVKVYDAWGGIVESVQLRPPPGALWYLVTEQPVYEFGIQDRFGFIPIQYVASVHNLGTMVVLPLILSLSLFLQGRVWSLARRSAGMRSGAMTSTGTLAGLLGASTSAVACCGASSGPVFLSLLGLGFGSASFITDWAEPLEALGMLVLTANVLGLAWWVGRRARCEGSTAQVTLRHAR